MVVVIAILLVIVLAAGGLIAWQARSAENTLKNELSAGATAIDKDRYDDAVASFRRATLAHSSVLDLGRKMHLSEGGLSRDETVQLYLAALLLKSYQNLFDMKSAQANIDEAEKQFNTLGAAGPSDLGKDIASAKACEQVRADISAGKVREGLKALLAADKAARKGDTDFSIQEIRLLIAGGKKLKSDAILNQARELLWLLSSHDEKNPRLNQLWGILSRP